jgi:hypothetical protein
MFYADGDGCGAIARQAKVFVECGHVNEALSASEPSTCHYEFRMTTPLACGSTMMGTIPCGELPARGTYPLLRAFLPFLVDSMLSESELKRLEEIEELYYDEELTEKVMPELKLTRTHPTR